jgi:hypothetical protein
MNPVLEWLESTWLSTTLRDSPNVFLYPTILAFHTLGLAFFVGISSAIALRVLGAARIVPLAPLKKFYPVMWIGFFFNAVSGFLLLIIEPTKFPTMFDFYVKIIVIAGAVYCNRALYIRCFRHPAAVDPYPLPARDRFLAVTILILWGAAITAGRLTAYDDANVQWQTAVATLAVSVVMLVIGYVVLRLFGWVRSGLRARDRVTVVPSHGNATVR